MQINDSARPVAPFWEFTTQRMRPIDPRKSRFTLLREPMPTSLAEVGHSGFTTLIAGGIVNPFGPTLTVLTADGHFPKAVGRVPVLLIALNPFAQTCHTVGHVEIGDLWSPLEDLEPFLASLAFGACPTLLIPSTFMDPDVTRALYARFLATFEDGAEVLAKVRRYPDDPWSRNLAGLDAVLRAERADEVPVKQGRLHPAEAMELATTLLTPDHVRTELVAFLDAWEAAVHFQSGDASPPSAMPVEDFVERLAQLCATCHLPFLN